MATPPAFVVVFLEPQFELPPLPPLAVSVPLVRTSVPVPATVEAMLLFVPLTIIAPSPVTLSVASSLKVIPVLAVSVVPAGNVRFTVPLTVI